MAHGFEQVLSISSVKNASNRNQFYPVKIYLTLGGDQEDQEARMWGEYSPDI